MQQISEFIVNKNEKIHLRHIHKEKCGTGILMLHGAIENGRIFYTESGKGLGCYLAEQGFDVYVADYRGRGESAPKIDQHTEHGQHHLIVEDIPELINYVYQQTGQPIHVVCHSWGGVLLASCLARFPELAKLIKSNVCFGTKRQVSVWNLERLFKVSLVWKRLAPFLVDKHGFLDAEKLKIGSDNESRLSLLESVNWVKRSPWHDMVDGFDYGQAAQHVEWPPTWHLTGVKDKVLGHAKDVQLFISESSKEVAKFSNLSKKQGNAMDYDHINILTHPKAVNDHFPLVVEWLQKHT